MIENEEKTIRAKIINNASEHFLTKGFKSVTMDDLASYMGMSKKTIYAYFKTKNDLVDTVTNYLFDTIGKGIDSICACNHNPIEELFIINDFVQKNLKNENSSPIFQLQKYYPKTHSKLLRKQFELAHECISRNLINGIKKGLYRKNIDVAFISRLYFSSSIGIKNQDMFPNEDFPSPKVMITYLDYHIHGISTKEGLKKLAQIQQKRNQ